MNPTISTQRPNEPSPSSILWAHQNRRENIQLADSIENLKTDHATTTHIISNLEKVLDHLKKRVDALEQQHVNDRTQLQSLENTYEALQARIRKLEAENRLSRTTIMALQRERPRRSTFNDGLRRVRASRVRNRALASAFPYPDAQQLSRQSSPAAVYPRDRQEDIHGRGTVSRPASAPQDWDPNSQQQSQRSSSEATWTPSLSDPPEPLHRRSGCSYSYNFRLRLPGIDNNAMDKKIEVATAERNVRKLLVQKQQTLAEYLESAISLRAEAPSMDERHFVEAFLGGLESRDLVQQIMDRVGQGRRIHPAGAWEKLTDAVRALIREEEVSTRLGGVRISQEGRMDNRVIGTGGDDATLGVPTKMPVIIWDTRRRRRAIPIVPPDEEDALLTASVYFPNRT